METWEGEDVARGVLCDRSRRRPRVRLLVAATAACTVSVVASAGPLVGLASAADVIDLGTLGGTESRATSVNDSGQVVGYSKTSSGNTHAFSWTPAGGLIDLGTFGGAESRAVAVNNAGQVVGWAETSSGARHAFAWTPAGGMVDMNTIGGESSPAAENGDGEVVGYFVPNEGPAQPFLWTRSGGMVDLGKAGGFGDAVAINESGQVLIQGDIAESASGGPFLWSAPGVYFQEIGTTPEAINDSGEVVGREGIISPHPYYWTHATGVVELPPIGVTPDGFDGWARAVNDSGVIVGSSSPASGGQEAFVWTPAHGTVGLGGFNGETGGEALAISNSSEVVGWAEARWPDDTYSQNAFSWTEAGGMVDLAEPGGFSHAVAVNREGGHVAGSEGIGGGRAVIWDTLPSEAATTPLTETLTMHGWTLSGTLSSTKLDRTIVLPAGSTISGSGQLNLDTGAGWLAATPSVPRFTTTIEPFGFIPIKLGLELAPTGPSEGTLARGENVSLTLPLKIGMRVDSLGVFGITLPISCTASQPLAVALTASVPRQQLVEGWSSSGSTSVPRLLCGTPLGGVLGPLLTTLLSGTEYTYSLKVHAPAL